MAKGDSDDTPVQVTVTEGPSAQEWASIKGVFVELYVHQGRKLSDIQRLLAVEYDFHATEKAYKRRITQWKAYKNYKSSEKKAVAESSTQFSAIHHAIPSASLHGKPIKWDRIKRFSRPPGAKRSRRAAGVPPIGEKIQLDLHPDNLRPAVTVDERILFLTKSYLDWNISKWCPLGIGKSSLDADHHQGKLKAPGEEPFALLFNKCFYNAIPLLLTNRTLEAFREINLACSLATRCLQLSPYWVFLRLLRLYSYPLWSRFPDVRRQIVGFLQALASRTLPNGHALKPLLEMWVQEEVGADAGRVASLLRLSSDTFGPASGLDAEEWAWIQDEICSLNYQRKELHDALRIARRLSEDPKVPRGVHITSRQMVARYHLQHGHIDEAESILLQTLRTCAECDTEDEKARFLQQTYSDLGYIWHVRQDRVRSLQYYERALEKAIQVNNGANTNSLRCRIETLTLQRDQGEAVSQTNEHQDSSWALWAFCRPYS
ncbi:hypothetical protein G647_03810 [Cladophialophora carrionii CBS 160.54]|uniref:Clr5 domain-containing protein n=1 Tax=Cladophialophora carrionii CBS 160.54 TaxID=1279043 RepID=V9DCP0_9EURO|nr:uncharacterized protein G647_03810 [Cladophialophora carrionii CBS 160.54]ETI24441.1 hypothetical protein G647_03810 [Cladophialophora carrionii CBS 160.54]